MTEASPRTSHRLLLLAAALLFSTGGAAIKATTLTSWQVAGFRSLTAAAAVLILVPAARRGWSWRIVPVGVAYGIMLVMFVNATKLTTSANAIFLESTAPLYLLIIGPVLLREPVRRSDLALAAAVGCGLALIFAVRENAVATAPDPARGNMVAALTGVVWAFTVAGLRWLAKDRTRADASMAMVVLGNVIAFLMCAPAVFPVGNASARDIVAVLYLGVFQVGLAYFCVARAIRHVPAFEAAAILLVEPALNPVWAWLMHGERPGAYAVAGGAIILGATLANTWWQAGRAPGGKAAG